MTPEKLLGLKDRLAGAKADMVAEVQAELNGMLAEARADIVPEILPELNGMLAEARREMEAEGDSEAETVKDRLAELAAQFEAELVEARLAELKTNIQAELEADMEKRLAELWDKWLAEAVEEGGATWE